MLRNQNTIPGGGVKAESTIIVSDDSSDVLVFPDAGGELSEDERMATDEVVFPAVVRCPVCRMVLGTAASRGSMQFAFRRIGMHMVWCHGKECLE